MAVDKSQLVQQLVPLIAAEIQIVQKSVDSASEAATHPEAKPENKYDTRGLEASYLAGAQRERLQELKAALAFLQNLPLRHFSEDERIAPTALVEVEHEGRAALYFLLPFGAGLTLQAEARTVTVLTPGAPLGQALLNKAAGDLITLRTGGTAKEYEILTVT